MRHSWFGYINQYRAKMKEKMFFQVTVIASWTHEITSTTLGLFVSFIEEDYIEFDFEERFRSGAWDFSHSNIRGHGNEDVSESILGYHEPYEVNIVCLNSQGSECPEIAEKVAQKIRARIEYLKTVIPRQDKLMF